MKKILFLSLLLISGSLFAQDNTQKAKTILDDLSKKVKGYSTMQIEFTMHLKTPDVNEQQKGKATTKGDKYYVEMAGKQIQSDGKKVWTYDPDANECVVTCLDDEETSDEEDLLNPSKMFSFWEDGLKYTYVQETTDGGVTVHEIKLVPKDPKKSKFSQITLYVNKAKTEIHKVIVKGKNGEVMTYKVSKFTPNVSTEDSDFKFNKSKHPGVTMIDC